MNESLSCEAKSSEVTGYEDVLATVEILGKRKSFKNSLGRLPWRLTFSIEKRTLRKLSPRLRWFFLRWFFGRKWKMVSAKDYVTSGGAQRTVVAREKAFTCSEPTFVGFVPDFVRGMRDLIEPEVAIIEYANALVLAGTDFVLKNGVCIHPDFFVAGRDFPMAENFGEIRIFPSESVLVTSILEPPSNVPAAISLLGQCAGSYAHFITEVLPKLLIIDSDSQYDDLPVLIDAWIDFALVSVLARFNLKRRKIYRVLLRRPVLVGRLVTVSPTSYTPPELRAVMEGLPKPRLSADTHKFSSHALSLVRAYGKKIAPEPASWIGDRVFIRRAGSMNGRGILNIDAIEAVAQRAGFQVIDPVTLSIEEQIALFRRARVIMSPIGGAMVNSVFAEPGCKIICLSAFFKHGEYDYHSQMQKVLGHDINFVVGPHLPGQTVHIMHRNFRVRMEDVLMAIRQAL